MLPADNFILPLLGRERQLPEAFARLAAKWLLSGENPHGLFQHPSMNFRICLRLVWTEEGFYRSRKEWASITSSVWGWLFWFLLAFLVFFVFFFFWLVLQKMVCGTSVQKGVCALDPSWTQRLLWSTWLQWAEEFSDVAMCFHPEQLLETVYAESCWFWILLLLVQFLESGWLKMGHCVWFSVLDFLLIEISVLLFFAHGKIKANMLQYLILELL